MFLLGGRLGLAARELLPLQPGTQVMHQRPRYAECGRSFFAPATWGVACNSLGQFQNRSEFLLLSF